jgi:hypothetical protein
LVQRQVSSNEQLAAIHLMLIIGIPRIMESGKRPAREGFPQKLPQLW